MRFTSIRSPQRQGHSSTAHFGVPVPMMNTFAARRLGKSVIVAMCCTSVRRRRLRNQRHMFKNHLTPVSRTYPEVAWCLRASNFRVEHKNIPLMEAVYFSELWSSQRDE